MNEEKILKLLNDINENLSTFSSVRYSERALYGELQTIKGKIAALKAVCESAFPEEDPRPSVPVKTLARVFEWDKEDKKNG